MVAFYFHNKCITTKRKSPFMLLNTFNDISFQKGSFGTVLRVARSSSSKQRADGKRRLFTLHLIEGHLKIGSASTTFISDSLLCLSLTQPLSLSLCSFCRSICFTHFSSMPSSLYQFISLSVLFVATFMLLYLLSFFHHKGPSRISQLHTSYFELYSHMTATGPRHGLSDLPK